MASGSANAGQQKFWNQQGGAVWSDVADVLDMAFQNATSHMLDAIDMQPDHAVLDIGCGAGASTIAAANRLPSGRATGIDISETLIDAARTRADDMGVANVEFIVADAQTLQFPATRFDALISRLGVMFFADPEAAFSNLATALKSGAAVSLLTWARSNENVWFSIREDTVARYFGPQNESAPSSPGPLSFESIDFVTSLLDRTGFTSAQGAELSCPLVVHAEPEAAAIALARISAVRVDAIPGAKPGDREQVERLMADELLRYRTEIGLVIPAVFNHFTARKP